MSKIITENYRRFGVEIELNTTTDIIKNKEESPDGADLVADIISKATGEPVEIYGWHHTNNNQAWIVKPDRSCGMEICTPIMKGYFDLIKLVYVIDKFRENDQIKSDKRCSLHVHVNLEDLNDIEIASVLAWWIKCEAVFFDSLPAYRRCSKHTQLIGISDAFSHDKNYSPSTVIEKLSDVKYHSINAYHMRMRRRRSIEIRLAENTACLDPFFVKNWIRLILHFVSMTYSKFPSRYNPENNMGGLVWLDPDEVFRLLNFYSPNLSVGMKQVRDWFVERLVTNACQGDEGIWSNTCRSRSINQIRNIADICPKQFHDMTDQELLYSSIFHI